MYEAPQYPKITAANAMTSAPALVTARRQPPPTAST
jgi:hypothetical protein